MSSDIKINSYIIWFEEMYFLELLSKLQYNFLQPFVTVLEAI